MMMMMMMITGGYPEIHGSIKEVNRWSSKKVQMLRGKVKVKLKLKVKVKLKVKRAVFLSPSARD
jgi:hypothetical protein